MLISLVITTYNRLDALEAVLRGVAAQTGTGFEVLIADDGGQVDVSGAIERFSETTDTPIHHVWHEDIGFTPGTIRNRAVEQAVGEYIVMLDGDCIVQPEFIATQRRLAERGWMVGGTRILLSETFTQRVLDDALPVHQWCAPQWIVARLNGDVNRCGPLCARLPGQAWRRMRSSSWRSLRTFCMSVHRDAFNAVGGFDEEFEGWGSEDSDLIVRLMHDGVRIKSGRWASPVLHLWHPEQPRDKAGENRARLEAALQRTQATPGSQAQGDQQSP